MTVKTLELLQRKDLTLQELAEHSPRSWDKVQKQVCQVLASRDHKKIADFALDAKKRADHWRLKIRKSHQNPRVVKGALPHLVESRLSHLALNQYVDAVVKKHGGGAKQEGVRRSLKPSLGFIFQKYLNNGRVHHQPFNLKSKYLWRFVRDKESLLGKAYREGVYCIFTKQLVEALTGLIEGRPTLEIAAGDGALTKFLEKDCQIQGTDDLSWQDKVSYGSWVEPLGAKPALEKYQPEVVICAFPPAPNTFEKEVFKTDSVQVYIVIGSRYEYAAGDSKSYKQQTKFSLDLL